MFSTLIHVVTIWIAMSWSIGIIWSVLCLACDGMAYVKLQRSRRLAESDVPATIILTLVGKHSQ
jgi:hypothetical protein